MMSDLRWTVPVARWAFKSVTDADTTPRLDFVAPMVWRRLSGLSKAALLVARDCCEDVNGPLRVVFASRHGELQRTTSILNDISAGEPVSPNAFSLSVLNAMPGIFSIARGDRTATTALAAGSETLGYALLEAAMQDAQQSGPPVLVVYAHEPADAVYGDVAGDTAPAALSILVDAAAPSAHLACTLSPRSHAVDASAAGAQSDALRHCLATHADSLWHGPRHVWHWSLHAGAV